MDALASPYAKALTQAIAQLYRAFDATQVMASLEVCRCDSCVYAPEIYRQMTTLAAKDWPVDLIVQYTNSAHGVPGDLDHLKAILPRTLELISADKLVDQNGLGTELLRIGQAWQSNPDLFNSFQVTALRRWLVTAMDHFIWLDGTEDGATFTAESLLEIFLVAQWPVLDLRTITEDKLDQPAFAAGFALWVTRNLVEKPNGFAPDIFALGYLPRKNLNAFFAWLNDPTFATRLSGFATSAECQDTHLYNGQVAARRYLAVAGHFNADLIGRS